jgi:hypothetical protein
MNSDVFYVTDKQSFRKRDAARIGYDDIVLLDIAVRIEIDNEIAAMPTSTPLFLP